jgi:hypothetical protein
MTIGRLLLTNWLCCPANFMLLCAAVLMGVCNLEYALKQKSPACGGAPVVSVYVDVLPNAQSSTREPRWRHQLRICKNAGVSENHFFSIILQLKAFKLTKANMWR